MRRWRAVRRGVLDRRSRLLAGQPLLARSLRAPGRRPAARTAPGPGLRAEIERPPAGPAGVRVTGRCPGSPRSATGRGRSWTEPPLITRPEPTEAEQLAEALDAYLTTLAAALGPRGRRLLAWSTSPTRWSGSGSVGLRAWVALCEGSSADDVPFLQLKQARRSVVAPFVHGESAWHAHQGQRVVEYQQALQTVSDPLLGWTSVGDVSTTCASSGT